MQSKKLFLSWNDMNNINRKTITTVCLLLLMSAFSGCGRKGPPVAPGVPELLPVAGLSHEISDGMVRISWETAKGGSASILTGYIVHRSVVPVDEESCEGCPVLFQRVAELDKTVLSYSEMVEKGNRYIYKVVSVSKYGTISPDSTFIRFIY
jgi:hypothetical protein